MTRSLLLALFVWSISASAQAQFIPERGRLFMAAKYADVEKLVEQEIKDDPRPPSSKLMYLCYAYGKLKRYNKLLPCLDRLTENVKRGDTAALDLDEMRKGNPLLFGLAAMGSMVIGGPDALKGDVRPFVPLMYAEAYTELRDYDKAIAAAQEAFAAIPQRWNEERGFRIQALTALGLSHAFAGRKEEAAKYAETLAAVSTSYPYTGLTDDKVMGVAKIYIALGDYKKAYDGMRSDSTGPLGAVLLGLGNVIGGGLAGMGGESLFTFQELPKQFMVVKTQLEVGEVKEAKIGYDKLLEIPRVRDNGEIYWVLLYDRGRIAAAENDLAGAIEFWKRAAEVIEQQRSTINTEANKIGFVGDKQAVYRKLIAGLFSLQRYPEAFEFLERSKSRALVDMLASKKDFAVATGDPEQVRALLVKADETELEARAQVAGDPAKRTLVTSSAQNLRQQAPELASLVSVSLISTAEIQALLPDGEVLVEYFYDDASLMAFILTREELKGVVLDATSLDANIRELRKAIESVDSLSYLPHAQALYGQLVAPIAPLLGDKKLILVPHGVMHYLPFAALHDGTGFMIDRYSMRLLPSASVIKYLRSATPAKSAGVLAFGNPDLGDPKYDLRHAQQEAMAVAQMVPLSKALLRKDATEAAFRKFAAGFNYIHFATHGEFRAEAPLDSSLLLASDESSDGHLTVGKLYSVRMDADLVTLSACETGLGKVANGDDVVGLTRGFLYAGASTIVASLWQVDDEATAQLMNHFYRGLTQGDKREALRQAQLAIRGRYPHPFFWAAFQLTGNAR